MKDLNLIKLTDLRNGMERKKGLESTINNRERKDVGLWDPMVLERQTFD